MRLALHLFLGNRGSVYGNVVNYTIHKTTIINTSMSTLFTDIDESSDLQGGVSVLLNNSMTLSNHHTWTGVGVIEAAVSELDAGCVAEARGAIDVVQSRSFTDASIVLAFTTRRSDCPTTADCSTSTAAREDATRPQHIQTNKNIFSNCPPRFGLNASRISTRRSTVVYDIQTDAIVRAADRSVAKSSCSRSETARMNERCCVRFRLLYVTNPIKLKDF